MVSQAIRSKKKSSPKRQALVKRDESMKEFWAKGTGFGTGSTTTQWDLEQVSSELDN